MPRVGAPQLPSTSHPRVGIAYAYPSWFVSIVELNRLACVVSLECMLVSS
jgi:hypothetical protein